MRDEGFRVLPRGMQFANRISVHGCYNGLGPTETHLLDRLDWYAAASGTRAKNDQRYAASHDLHSRKQGSLGSHFARTPIGLR